MAPPYGFEILENCLTCKWRTDQFFCSLSSDALKAFDSITFTTVYPAGSILYTEGQAPRGVFMLCNGRAKLSVTSSEGKRLITRVAEPGEVLGISCVISGKSYKSTAETLEPSQINFVKRDDFLRFLQNFGEACLHAAEQLSEECLVANDHVRSLGLSHSAAEKLAHLLLEWCDEAGNTTESGTRVKLMMTHEEISQMIGTSRETVTRLLGELKDQKVLSIKGSTLLIHDKSALEALVFI